MLLKNSYLRYFVSTAARNSQGVRLRTRAFRITLHSAVPHETQALQPQCAGRPDAEGEASWFLEL